VAAREAKKASKLKRRLSSGRPISKKDPTWTKAPTKVSKEGSNGLLESGKRNHKPSQIAPMPPNYSLLRYNFLLITVDLSKNNPTEGGMGLDIVGNNREVPREDRRGGQPVAGSGLGAVCL